MLYPRIPTREMNICTPVPCSVSDKQQHNEVNAEGTLYPTPTADIKVPKNANVNIEPKFRKKFSWDEFDGYFSVLSNTGSDPPALVHSLN